MYRIKRVDGEDDEIAELIHEIHFECFGDGAPRVDPLCGWWWLAFACDGARAVAGFCWLKPTEAAPTTIAYLARAGVLLPHRGQGLQRRMVRVREGLARRAGFRTVVTDTTDNPASSNSLIACGYRIYRPPEPWAFNHSIYWYKDL
jgi:GNAT superfamily N-acetyltransferase